MVDYYAFIVIIFLLLVIIVQRERAKISAKKERFGSGRNITDASIVQGKKAKVVRRHVS